MAKVVLIMGVAGVGKTTLGRLLADRMDWTFIDADQFHPAANISKMASGTPLDESDRLPWLDAMATALHHSMPLSQPIILACSALKASYRLRLLETIEDHLVVFLQAPYEVVHTRCQTRTGHFYPPSLLASQYADLEPPTQALILDASQSPRRLVKLIEARLKQKTPL